MEADLAVSDDLARLAGALGVATEYWDWRGRRVAVGRATLVAVLAALDVDASTDDAIAVALAEVDQRPWRRPVPPVTVVREGDSARLPVRVPAVADMHVVVETEDGGRRELAVSATVPGQSAAEVVVSGERIVETGYELPDDLPLGWHTVAVTLAGSAGQAGGAESSTCRPSGGPVETSQPEAAGDDAAGNDAAGDDTAQTRRHEGVLVVVPTLVPLPPSIMQRRLWGVMAQLYQVRSAASWGHGDLADLGELVAWSARSHDAGFVLVNPLHAPDPTEPVEASPYLPSSRRFVSPLYLRVEDIRETAYLAAADRAIVEWHAEELRGLNRSDELIDRDAVWRAKLAALERVYAVPRSPARQAAFAAFCEREGEGLLDWATWCALREHYGVPPASWPAHVGRPDLPAVADLQQELADRIAFHCWLQWVTDEQLQRVQREARGAGMALGVVHELAVGVHPDGAEAWALQDTLAQGVSVGAPPDAFNQVGQDWSQPPWRPDALAERAYRPYRDMLRSLLRHSGGIRIDHVMGLFRLWWIPDGAGPAQGTYVRYDHEALVGILALEASRAGAVVIGEDLGNVEPSVRVHLRDRGVLGTSILWFEKDDTGRPRRPRDWRGLCLATVATHDLPPAAGYLTGVHLDVRERLGLLTQDPTEERRRDEADRQSFVDLLVELGLVAEHPSADDIVTGLHRMLTWTPARLVGVALPDLVGDRIPVNQPGTDEEYPNWRIPLADGVGTPILVEDVLVSSRAAELARIVAGGL